MNEWRIYNAVPALSFRLQNSVMGVSHFQLVSGSLHMKNHRGTCPPSWHLWRFGQIQYGGRRPQLKFHHFFVSYTIFKCKTSNGTDFGMQNSFLILFSSFRVIFICKGHFQGRCVTAEMSSTVWLNIISVETGVLPLIKLKNRSYDNRGAYRPSWRE